MESLDTGNCHWQSHDPPARPQTGYYAQAGTVATVKHCFGGYRLPEGLRPWNRVMIKSFDHGYYKVERLGKVFTIFQANIRDSELQAIQRNERA